MKTSQTLQPCLGWRSILTTSLLITVLFFGKGTFTNAEPSEGSKTDVLKLSEIAPAKVIEGQINDYMKRLGESLSDKAKYSSAKKARVSKDAATVGVLFLSTGLSDEASTLQKSAPALVAKAMELADNTEDYEKSLAAYESIVKGMQDGLEGGEALSWETEFDLESLMKQTSTLEAAIKRNSSTESRFEKKKDEIAGAAVLVALIGQAIHLNEDYTDSSNVQKWRDSSMSMRDASGNVAKGALQGDYKLVEKNVPIIGQSCTDCHKAFDVDE